MYCVQRNHGSCAVRIHSEALIDLLRGEIWGATEDTGDLVGVPEQLVGCILDDTIRIIGEDVLLEGVEPPMEIP
jgi:hypothetical protein